MSGPIEFRYYLRRFGMADMYAGAQPIRLPQGPAGKVQMFAPPELQVRYRRKPANPSEIATWSEWVPVPIVKEGDDEAILASMDPPAGLTPS